MTYERGSFDYVGVFYNIAQIRPLIPIAIEFNVP